MDIANRRDLEPALTLLVEASKQLKVEQRALTKAR